MPPRRRERLQWPRKSGPVSRRSCRCTLQDSSVFTAALVRNAVLNPTNLLDARIRRQEVAMRLTLRTVLAYLEDALPPESARRIGRMIGRSPAARRIVARIRKVVRRRRLIAVKPDSDSKKGMDANDMSEYLDNTLPEEQLHRVERRCLKHDALLA